MPGPTHLIRADRWNGVRRGDPVVVVGPKGRQSWTFVAHVRNEETGEEWVDVRGGRVGEMKSRSFECGQIYPWAARRGASGVGPSLATAPQLALE